MRDNLTGTGIARNIQWQAGCLSGRSSIQIPLFVFLAQSRAVPTPQLVLRGK
jgi:hypothetical protein